MRVEASKTSRTPPCPSGERLQVASFDRSIGHETSRSTTPKHAWLTHAAPDNLMEITERNFHPGIIATHHFDCVGDTFIIDICRKVGGRGKTRCGA